MWYDEDVYDLEEATELRLQEQAVLVLGYN